MRLFWLFVLIGVSASHSIDICGSDGCSIEQARTFMTNKIIEYKRKVDEWSRQRDQLVSDLRQFISIKSNAVKDKFHETERDMNSQITDWKNKQRESLTWQRSDLNAEADRMLKELDRLISKESVLQGTLEWNTCQSHKLNQLIQLRESMIHTINTLRDNGQQKIDHLNSQLNDINKLSSYLAEHVNELNSKIDQLAAESEDLINKWSLKVQRDIDATTETLSKREEAFAVSLESDLDKTVDQFMAWSEGTEQDFEAAFKSIDEQTIKNRNKIEQLFTLGEFNSIEEWKNEFSAKLQTASDMMKADIDKFRENLSYDFAQIRKKFQQFR